MTQLDYYSGKRVLVPGGAGVIGREMIAQLLNEGAIVLCCDLKPRPEVFPSAVEYVQGDANYLSKACVTDFRPDVCVHLAATFERSVETEEFWDENYWHNIRLSHHLMTLLKDVPSLRRVVFASSYLIYDPADYSFDAPQTEPVVLTESQVIYPRNICGAAKLLHELELRFLTEFEGASFTAISARIFRVYGRGSRDIVSRWVRTLLDEPTATLKLFRKEGIFDYVFAGDVAEGLLRLGASEAEGIVNLGSGESRSVAELVDVLRDNFPNLSVEDVDADIAWEAHEADLTRLVSLTEWRPKHNLESGIALLIEYERSVRSAKAGIETPQSANVLITSASRKVDLVKRYQQALRELGLNGVVWAADSNPECVAAAFADSFWAMPRLSELTTDALVAFCRDNRISVLVPTRDRELDYFAERANALGEVGVFVPLGAPTQVADCLDKLAFYERCQAADLPAIPTYASLEACLAAGHTGPLVVKERYGAGSRTLGLSLDPKSAQIHAAGLDRPIFQPMVDGEEHSIDLYRSRSGQVIEVVPRVRSQVHAGESVVSRTVENPDLVDQSVALANTFDIRGHAVLQAFVTDKGIQFIECNPRFGGASALSIQAGLASPKWSLLEATGTQLKPVRGAYEVGLQLLRYSADHFVSNSCD